MYRKVFICSLTVSLILSFSSGPSFSKGLNFGIISAIEDKIGELKEKIQPEVTHYKSITGADGIAQFTLENGQTASVKTIDQRTGDPVSEIDAYLITNQTDGAYLLVDPEQKYAPRLINAVNPAPAPSHLFGTIREAVLHFWGTLTGEPKVHTMDVVPPDLREYIQEHFFTWWRDTTFGSLERDLYEWIELGLDQGITIAMAWLLPPVGVAFYIINTAVSVQEIMTTGAYDWWARYYYNLGYQPTDECEIWKAPLPIFDPEYRGLIAGILVIPKEPLPEWDTTASISGRVKDARTGEYLANVELVLTPTAKKIFSHSDGRYIFSDVPVIENMQPPYYTITATKVGYGQESISNIQVSPGEETEVNISFNPAIVMFAGSSNPGVVYGYMGGTQWDAISLELGYAVLSLAEYNGHLYAGTMSTSDPESGVGRVYRYDGGTSWTLVGDNMDDQVSSLAVYQGNLYAGTAWNGMKLYKYDGGTTWIQVISPVVWNGTRSLYVSRGYLFMGDTYWDYIGHWDGSIFYMDQTASTGSCIYDFADYGDYIYAAAYGGRMWRSSDGVSWSQVLSGYGAHMWELEIFQDLFYMAYDNGELRASNVPDRGTLVFQAPDGIISMETDGNYLYFGTGGETGYDGETSGISKIYSYDGDQVQSISDTLGEGIQVLYIP